MGLNREPLLLLVPCTPLNFPPLRAPVFLSALRCRARGLERGAGAQCANPHPLALRHTWLS